MSIATGQFTIIDYNDALTLTGFIGSSQPKTQQFNPDNGTYNPDWVSSNLALTPSLYKLGSSADIIADVAVTSVQWYSVANGVETLITADANHVYSGTKNQILTIKSNELSALSSKDYVCKITYHDATTNLDLTTKLSISFSKVVNGGGIADAVAWAPGGNIFKNGGIATVVAKCDLWRGSVIDTSSVTYQWYMQDPSITSASGALYDANAGAGWRKLTDLASNVTGCATNTLTVYDAYVANYAVLKCQIKDTDASSNTYLQYFYDTLSIVDLSDTIQLTVTSSGGDVFKNGVGSTTLTAKVFRAGVDITANYSAANFKWYQYDKDGVINVNFGGTGINFKTGLTLAVGDADVTVKATFMVELS